jgi:hypothetical protein
MADHHDFNKLEFPSPKDAFSQVWLKLAHWFFRRRFLNDHTLFLHFCDYLPFEEGQALRLNKFLSSGELKSIYLPNIY